MAIDLAPRFFRRIDPARNMARYYCVMMQPTLFGETSLIRQWGRLGTHGRQKIEYFDSEAEASEAMSWQMRRRLKRGYYDVGG